MSFQKPRFHGLMRAPWYGQEMPGPISFTLPVIVNRDTSRRALAEDYGRAEILIQNKSAGDVYLQFDSPADAESGLTIPAGGSWGPSIVASTNQIFLRGSMIVDQRVIVAVTRR